MELLRVIAGQSITQRFLLHFGKSVLHPWPCTASATTQHRIYPDKIGNYSGGKSCNSAAPHSTVQPVAN